MPYRTLISERADEAHATAAVWAKGAVNGKNSGAKSRPRSAMRPILGGDGAGGLDARVNHLNRMLVAKRLNQTSDIRGHKIN